MTILITVVENGFIIEVTKTGCVEGIQYVAETEKSLLDTISTIWRDYKNEQAKKGGPR